MAQDPNQRTFAEISQSLKDINERDAVNNQLARNEKLLDKAIDNKNKKLNEEQINQLKQTKALLKNDNLQNMEDKREANRQLNEQLRLLGIIADKESLSLKDQNIIGNIIGSVLAPISFIAGVGFGIRDSLARLLNLFDIELNKPFKEMLTKAKFGMIRFFKIPTVFFADLIARIIDIFDFKNIKVNVISAEIQRRIYNFTKNIKRFFFPLILAKELAKSLGSIIKALVIDFGSNLKAGIAGTIGKRPIVAQLDKLLKARLLQAMDFGPVDPRTTPGKIDFRSRSKDTKVVKNIMKFAQNIGKFLRPILMLVKGFTTLFLLPVAFFTKVFGAELKDVTKGLKGAKDGIKGAGKSVGFITKTLGPIGTAIKNISKVAFKFGRVLGKFFVPLAAIIAVFDTVRGAIEGWTNTEGNFFMKAIGAWFGAVKGLLNSVIGGLLDLLKDGISWVLGKLGFDKAAAVLDSFSFQEIISKIVDAVKDGLFAVIDFFGNAASKVGSFIGGGFDMVNNFIKALLQSVLPDPDSESLIPRMAAKAVPSFVYEYAGMDPDTGDVIEKFESKGVDALGAIVPYTPLGAAANGIQMLQRRINNNNQSNHNYYTADPTDQVGNALNSPT